MALTGFAWCRHPHCLKSLIQLPWRHKVNMKMSVLVGPSVPPAVSYTKRGQALSVESDHREEWDGARRLELSTSKGDVPASPLGVQERKKTSSTVGVCAGSDMMLKADME